MNTNVEKLKGTEIKSEEPEKVGFIAVTNQGAFVARAKVIYIFSEKIIVKNIPSLSVLQSAFFLIPDDILKITFNVDICSFFGVWTTIFRKNFYEVISKCYELYGTTSSPQCVEVPCNFNDNNLNPVPQVIISPYKCCCSCRYCCNYCCNPQFHNPYVNFYNCLENGYGYN